MFFWFLDPFEKWKLLRGRQQPVHNDSAMHVFSLCRELCAIKPGSRKPGDGPTIGVTFACLLPRWEEVTKCPCAPQMVPLWSRLGRERSAIGVFSGTVKLDNLQNHIDTIIINTNIFTCTCLPLKQDVKSRLLSGQGCRHIPVATRFQLYVLFPLGFEISPFAEAAGGKVGSGLRV